MRQQRPRGTTTRDAVVHAALEVVDRVSLEGLTIRAVAAAVNAPPMSLYTHFANKEELLDLLYGEVARRLYVDAGLASWQAELLALARHIRETLLAHPSWTPLLSRRALPTSLAVRERILNSMVADGFSAAAALASLSGAILATIGLVLVELTFRDPDGGSALSRRFDGLKAWFDLNPEAPHEPTTREAFAREASLDLGKTFEYCVSALISGLEQKRGAGGLA